jgi:hypothetical protein
MLLKCYRPAFFSLSSTLSYTSEFFLYLNVPPLVCGISSYLIIVWRNSYFSLPLKANDN